MARRARRGLRRRPKENRKKRKEGERRNGRRPLHPHGWLGKRRRREENDNTKQETRHRKSWLAVLAVAALALAVVAVPQSALADGHWQDEIEFQPPEPVPGRRMFVEGLRVSGDSARVALRAATDLDLRVRAYGGPQGRWLRFFGTARLHEGERIEYSLPLSGESPSLTFSWEDELGQAGAVTFKDEQIPYPLPSAEGELCGLSVASLGWSPGSVEGAVASECVAEIEEAVTLQTVAGHHSETVTALLDAEITAITGTVTVAVGGVAHERVVRPGGETRFSIPVPIGRGRPRRGNRGGASGGAEDSHAPAGAAHPPPGADRAPHRDGAPGAARDNRDRQRDGHGDPRRRDDDGAHRHGRLSIPSAVVYRDVTLTIVHPERVEAEVVEREPVTGSRDETLALASQRRGRRPLPGPRAARARAGTRPRRADAPHRPGDARPVRTLRMAVAVVKRVIATLLLAGAALASVGAAPAEEREMLQAVSDALTAMAYAASGLCLFAIVWAGFVLMAEGGEERGGGRAKSAVVGAVVGLVLALSAKGVAVALLKGIVP